MDDKGVASRNGAAIATAQLYDPKSGTWSATGSLKSARVVQTATLLPNANVLVAGDDSSSASALASAELYLTNGPYTAPRNISTRCEVESGGKVLIGGFIIGGSVAKKVIIRALGPSLATRGIIGALSDPTLELYEPDGTRVFNDDWKENQAAVEASGIPPERDEESAIVATLPPGVYTAIVRSKTDTAGVGLVEVYDLDGLAPSFTRPYANRKIKPSAPCRVAQSRCSDSRHPRGRFYNFRLGLTADWPRVFAEAARMDKALEIDSYPDRQDLNVSLLKLASKSGCRIAIGTDAHHATQLEFIELGLAAALIAGIRGDRIVNFMTLAQLRDWVSRVRA